MFHIGEDFFSFFLQQSENERRHKLKQMLQMIQVCSDDQNHEAHVN